MVGQSSGSHSRQRLKARADSRDGKASARRRRTARSQRERPTLASRAAERPSNVVDFPVPAAAAPVPLGGFLFFLIWLLRLIILGAGLGAILGTTLAIVRPQDRPVVEAAAPVVPADPPSSASPAVLRPTRELRQLRDRFAVLASAQPQLTPGAYFIDLDTGEYLDLRGEEQFSAASTIKVPVLVALFQAVEAGTVTLDERLTMRPDLIGGGSGALQYQPVNSDYSVLELAEKTIIVSDNTATNLLIDRLGGAAVLNAQFREWGLEQTALQNLLPDLSGTNTTSPQDLVRLMATLEQGRLVTPQSRDRILAIMRRTQTRTLLPQGLGEGATIAHKTGDIGSLVGDVGLIDLPSGKRYLAAVLVKRPHNDRNAQALIRAYSRAAYRHFTQTLPRTAEFTAPASQATDSDLP